MGILEAVVLGLVQGLTEFLPVSSSGHIELGTAILGTDPAENLLFSITVHSATALSTIVVFRKDLWAIVREVLQFRMNESTLYVIKIIVSMIPVGIAGVFFKEDIEGLFTGNVLLVGAMLLITGGLLTFTYMKSAGTEKVGFTAAFIIGLAQMLAILPGISRSGATISTALLLGIEKDRATRFSFLMVIIPIVGASMLEAWSLFESPHSAKIQISVLLAGFMTAFMAGLLACSWMIRIVRRGKLIYFAIYCFVLGASAVIMHYML